MGMYTELVLKVRLEKSIPEDVKNILKFLFSDKEEPSIIPDHPFFQCERWQCVGRCSSFYHHPESVSSFNEEGSSYAIFSRSDLKNYDSEIGKFIDWLTPYLMHRRKCIGWTWYEEEQEPTLLYLKDFKD